MGKALLALILLVQAADDKAAVDEAIKKFAKAFSNPSASARAAAVTELSGTQHDKTLNRILPLLSSDVTDVRVNAAEALAKFGDWKKIVTPALMDAVKFNLKDSKVEAAIFKTLGKLADPIALPIVHGNFKEPDFRIASAAVACAGDMRQKESMDALLELQKEVQTWLKHKQSGPYRDEKGQQGNEGDFTKRLNELQKEIIKAYQTITKEKWATANEWEIWWGKKKATFEIPK
jgi:HEAT repeat protein